MTMLDEKRLVVQAMLCINCTFIGNRFINDNECEWRYFTIFDNRNFFVLYGLSKNGQYVCYTSAYSLVKTLGIIKTFECSFGKVYNPFFGVSSSEELAIQLELLENDKLSIARVEE